MKNKILYTVIILVLTLSFLLTSCNNEIEEKGTTIVCLGDSLTAGYGATTPGVDDKSKSYPFFLQSKVNLPVVNAGVSGDTSAHGLARVNKDVLSHDPQIVIILLGANDFFSNLLNPTPVVTTKNNLLEIIKKVNNGIREIYLVKFYTPAVALELGSSNGIPNELVQDLINQYDAMFNSLASEKNVTLIEDIWSGIYGVHMSDQVHPNAAGYEIMANLIFNAMEPYLKSGGYLK